MSSSYNLIRVRVLIAALIPLAALELSAGCGGRTPEQQRISITINDLPHAGTSGAEVTEKISGRVSGVTSDKQIVLYARSGVWWVQPFRSRPFTKIEPDATWNNVTHLGTEYAALVVEPGYRPQATLKQLPSSGGDVLAVATAKGAAAPTVASKVIRFSGYNWVVRAGTGNRSGELNKYDSDNAWVDPKGYLHLKMGDHAGVWTSAEVNLTRSLGYGTYRFTVQDSAHLEPSVVVSMFTLDERSDRDVRSELDIELSRWGKTGKLNGDYTIQPYYVPENTMHFSVPAGRFTHVLRWEPGRALFTTFYGPTAVPGARELSHHAFTSGVPVPGSETVHIDFYDFFHSQRGITRPAEVVIEKFEYLP